MDAGGHAGAGKNGGDGYRFGPFLVDAAAYTLTRDGEPQALEPKAFAVLLHLLRHAGELVRHDELLDAVWGHRHVTPGVLTRAIAQLRHVLDDDSHHPQYIQTQHGLGYRFIGELKSWPQGEEPPARALVAPAAEPARTEAFDASATGDTHQAGVTTRPAAITLNAQAGDVPRRTERPRMGRWWPLLALVLVLAVLGTWQWYRPSRPAPPTPAEPSIAIVPFTSLSPNRSDSYFAEGLAVELHGALADVPGLKVAACQARSACGTQGADARKLGRLLGVATVLGADVRREGNKVRVNARLTDTRTGYTLWSGSYDRELNGVFALQSELARDVVQSLLGVLPRDTRGLTRRLSPTTNVTAYDAYLHGVQQLEQRAGGDGSGSVRSIGFFREALAADPGFARAQAGICRAEIIAFEGAHDAAAFERAQAACRRAAAMDPSLLEVSLALGDLYRAHDDNAQAAEHYRKALRALALRPDAYVGLARIESSQGRNDLALDYFERARQLRPGDPAIYRAIGFQHYLRGDRAKAISGFVTATTLSPDDEDLWASLGGLYMVSGDAARAADAYSRSLTIKPNYPALTNFGTLRYEQGRYAEAADLYRRAAKIDDSDYRTWGNLGDALSALPETAARAREPYERAAHMAQQYVDIKPSDAHALAVLAWYRANLGQEHESRELIERAQALGAEPGEVAFWAAQAFARLGEPAEARKWLQRAQVGGVNAPRFKASPVLRPLLEPSSSQRQANAR